MTITTNRPVASMLHFGRAAFMSLFLANAHCGGEVAVEGPNGNGYDSQESGDSSKNGNSSLQGNEPYGTPCAFLSGTVSLSTYSNEENYNEALFSFEFASKDIKVNHNDGDLLYESNYFDVKTVTDDKSFIVDLGAIPLVEVPETVDADDYPTGNWGEHDAIQALLFHTYIVRTIDGNTRQWAAFRVTALSPGVEVTIEWIRSTDPDRLIVPLDCLSN